MTPIPKEISEALDALTDTAFLCGYSHESPPGGEREEVAAESRARVEQLIAELVRDAERYRWRIDQIKELCGNPTNVSLMATKQFLAESVLHWLDRDPPTDAARAAGGEG